MSLEMMLKRLGLSTVQRVLPELTPLAEKEGWSYPQFLERLVSEEIAQRSERRIASQVARAKFPFHGTIETFDFTFRSELKRQMLGRFLGPELISRHSALPTGTLTIMLSLNTISSTLVKRNLEIAISFDDYH